MNALATAILAAVLAVPPAAAADYNVLAYALATVEGAQQTCGFHANLGVIASLAAIRSHWPSLRGTWP